MMTRILGKQREFDSELNKFELNYMKTNEGAIPAVDIYRKNVTIYKRFTSKRELLSLCYGIGE